MSWHLNTLLYANYLEKNKTFRKELILDNVTGMNEISALIGGDIRVSIFRLVFPPFFHVKL